MTQRNWTRTLGLLALSTTLTLGAARAEEDTSGVLGQGEATPSSARDFWAAPDFDLDRDLPSIGNFRRKGEDDRPFGNGFGMAYRAQQQVRARQGEFLANASSFLGRDERLGEANEVRQVRAYEEDSRRVRSESLFGEGNEKTAAVDLLRALEVAQERNQLVTLTSADGDHRRYLYVYRARELADGVRAYSFYDPHMSWDADEGVNTYRTSTLVSFGRRFFVDANWSRVATGEGAAPFVHGQQVSGLQLHHELGNRPYVEVSADQLGAAFEGGRWVWQTGYNWERAVEAYDTENSVRDEVLDAAETVIQRTPIGSIRDALNSMNQTDPLEFGSFDAIDPFLTEL